MKNNSRFLSGFLLGFVCMIVLGRYFFGDRIANTHPLTALENASWNVDEQVMFEKYHLVDNILQKEYFDKDHIDQKKMYESAVKGYVDALGDPYTLYLTSEENEVFEEEMQGGQHFAGIGAIVTKKKDGVMIEEVLKDLPAYKAWLKPLDIVISIDGEETKDLSINEAVKKIRGEKWTVVKLTIYRESEWRVFDVDVTRDIVDVPSVKWEIFDVSWKKVLYIEISIIGEDTVKVFKNIIDQYRGKFDALILDLRWNGGWYLPTAVDLVSYFLPKNELITTARYTVLEDEIYRSKGYGDLVWIPIAVLVDGLSASASEIIASALDEKDNALLIGTKTFGKGSIQTLAEFGDGSSLKYTIGKRYTPSDKNVDKEGLIPDIEVPFDFTWYVENKVDNQLERAKEEVVKIKTLKN